MLDFFDLEAGFVMRVLGGEEVENLRVWEVRWLRGGLEVRRRDLGVYSGSFSSSSEASKRSLMESLIDSSLIDSPMPSFSL